MMIPLLTQIYMNHFYPFCLILRRIILLILNVGFFFFHLGIFKLKRLSFLP